MQRQTDQGNSQWPVNQGEAPSKSLEIGQAHTSSAARQGAPNTFGQPRTENRQRVQNSHPNTVVIPASSNFQVLQQSASSRKPHTGPNPSTQPTHVQQVAPNRSSPSQHSQMEATVQEQVRNVLWGMLDEQPNQSPVPQRSQQKEQQVVRSQPQKPASVKQSHPQPPPPQEVIDYAQIPHPPTHQVVRKANSQSQQPVQQGNVPVSDIVQQNMELKQQLYDYRVKYEELVDELMSKEETAANLRDLAIEYERLEAQRNNLYNMVREIQTELQRAREMEQNYNLIQIELRETKDRQMEIEQAVSERNEEIGELKEYIQRISQEHNQLLEEREQMIEEREKIRLYVEEEQKRVFSYQTYTENVASENKQLLQMSEQYRIDRENLMAELNRRIMEDRNTGGGNNYDVQRLNSLLRIKENEVAQLMTRINSDSSTTAAGQEAEFKIVSLEKRVEVLSTEIEKYNTTLITKNKEICELKSQNFELDKLSKNNIELKSAQYEVEKLTEILHNKSSELTNLKANYHILEKKYIQAQNNSRQFDSIKGSISEIESTRQALHKKEIELNRLKQNAAARQSSAADLSIENEQLKKTIQSLESHVDTDREQYRNKLNQLDQKVVEQDKRHRQIEKQLRDKLGQLQSERYTYKSNEQDRLDRIRFLQTQLADSAKMVEHQRSEYFNLRKSYEDKLYTLEGTRSELESRLNHVLYDLELKDNEINRLDGQLKALSSNFNELRNQNIHNLNALNQLKLVHQKTSNELENRKAEFEDAMQRSIKDNDAYQETIKQQETRIDEIHNETINLRKSPIRDSSSREHQAVQKQLHELQLQVQHFQQLQLDSNKLADLHKEILVQQNQIDNLHRQLEEKKAQEQTRIRENQQSRLKFENTIVQLQKQLKHEQHHHSELKRTIQQERLISDQSKALSHKQEELKQKYPQQGTQTPSKQTHHERQHSELSQHSQVQPTQQLQPNKKTANNINKRTDIFVEIRKENETLKAKLNNYSVQASEYNAMVGQIIQVHDRLTGFCQRVSLLLQEDERAHVAHGEHNLKVVVNQLTDRLRKFQQQNEELKKSGARSRQIVKVTLLPQGNPMEHMCQELLEENDSLRNLCDEYEGRIKEYQSEFIKLAHSPPSDFLRPSISNPFDIRNTIRALEDKVQYFKMKNSEYQERVHQLLKLNGDLKGELQMCKGKSNEKDTEFYKQQFEYSERNLSTVQDKLKQALEELSYVRNTQLTRASQLNADLAGKLSQMQATIFDLNLKINTSQTEKVYAEDQRRQLITKMDGYNVEIKRLKITEKEQNNLIESLTQQLQDIQVQKGIMTSKVSQLIAEVNRFSQSNNDLQVMLNLKLEQKKLIEAQLIKANETVDGLSQQINIIRADLIRSENILNLTDNVVFYLDRAKASIADMQTQLPELRSISNTILPFSLAEAISKTVSIFKEIEFSKASIKDTRKAIGNKSSYVVPISTTY